MPRAKAGSSSGGAKKPRAPKGPKLPDPFASGTILTDVRKKQWKLGNQIGQGGFGLIYLASDDVTSTVGPGAEYVVKIEPHTNGPLFCELHFYQRAAKPEMIDNWCSSNRLRYLGIPKFIASGSYMRNKENFRFMVMPRFGPDLQKVFEQSGKVLEKHTVYCLALRTIDALEYLHDNHYVHADIKASNMLLGFHGGKVLPNEVYLVDFGLVHRYRPSDVHKPYKEDPKRCHDGTVEFTSIDAHKGVAPSRRGDMEILGYCLLQWLCSRLPWEDNLNNKDYVRDAKIRYLQDLNGLMKKCFPSGSPPAEIVQYLNLVKKLGYDERPNYDQLRGIFKEGLKKLSWRDEWKLDLPVTETGAKKAAKHKASTSEAKAPKQSKPAARGRKKDIEDLKSPVVKSPLPAKSPVKSPAPRRVMSPKTVVKSEPQSPRKSVGTPQAAGRKGTPTPKTLKRQLKSPRSETPPVKRQKETPVNSVGSNRRFVKKSKAPKVDAWMQTSPQ